MVVIIIYHDIGTFLSTKGGREVTLKKIHCRFLTSLQCIEAIFDHEMEL